MTVKEILEGLSKLSDPEEDDTQWITCLAIEVMASGISGDEDPSSTWEAATESRRIALKVRELAEAARKVLAGAEAGVSPDRLDENQACAAIAKTWAESDLPISNVARHAAQCIETAILDRMTGALVARKSEDA